MDLNEGVSRHAAGAGGHADGSGHTRHGAARESESAGVYHGGGEARAGAAASVLPDEETLAKFRRAAREAEAAGDAEGAGLAALALVEEWGARLPVGELREAFESALTRLSGSRLPGVRERLIECSHRIVEALTPRRHAAEDAAELVGRDASARRWADFSLKEQVHAYEAELIERALRDAGGSVSRAAKLLGFKHHNNLVSMLNTRHRGLLPERTPVVRRRRSIIPRDKLRPRGAAA